MRTTVWPARHGETPWAAEDRYNGRQDTPLTERGRAQAQRLSKRLGSEPLAAVYCSSLQRCVETAMIVAAPHGLVPIPRDALVEVDYGTWGGDKHDYLSFGSYWWPDPDKPDGLPYIRRDGGVNPESQSGSSDRPALSREVAAHRAQLLYPDRVR